MTPRRCCPTRRRALKRRFARRAARMARARSSSIPALDVEAVGFAPWKRPLARRARHAVVHEPHARAARCRGLAAARRTARSAATRFPPAPTNSSAPATRRRANTSSARCSRRSANSPITRRRGSSPRLARDGAVRHGERRDADDAGGESGASARAARPDRGAARSAAVEARLPSRALCRSEP